jgi:hypothetical protein
VRRLRSDVLNGLAFARAERLAVISYSLMVIGKLVARGEVSHREEHRLQAGFA